MTAPLTVALRVLPHGQGLPIPHYATAQSAGCDLPAAVAQDVTLRPGERRAIPTGFALALPEGYEAQIRPRSGLALKHGVTVANAPGTIDADYRGEIQALLINLGQEDFVVTRGMRIAQLIVAPVVQARFQLSETLDDTARGQGGFGSTGLDSSLPLEGGGAGWGLLPLSREEKPSPRPSPQMGEGEGDTC